MDKHNAWYMIARARRTCTGVQNATLTVAARSMDTPCTREQFTRYEKIFEDEYAKQSVKFGIKPRSAYQR